MRHFVAWRTLVSLGVALPFVFQAQAASPATLAAGRPTITIPSRVHQGGLSAADVLRLSSTANQRVMIILRNQHADLPARGATRPQRLAAVASDQAAILSELAQLHAPRVRAYHLVNVIAATVSPAEAQRLAANPAVKAVVPDAVIRLPRHTHEVATAAKAVQPTAALTCTIHPLLEPEALQLTQTAFRNPLIPQAQNLVTGKGVTVAFIADGLDINNPDFIRPDGTSVFSDYQDFSGDGINAPTFGGEAFGDASSIAAQGNLTYNVNAFVNVAHQLPLPCPKINILGVAPGASLMALKAFGFSNQAFNSTIVQAIEYAVDHGADVINESFGGNPFPDRDTDPVALANDAAVAAGVTVVASTGDAGTAGTIGSPATDPNVIAAGATTSHRVYAQTVAYGFQLGSGGYIDDNISSLSSGGITQRGNKTVDVVAPGDLGWALCSTNTAMYVDCTDNNGNPSPIQVFGGTSESSPLTAAEAALIIQAYRQTHGGTSPSPALIKTIIKSTATDLGVPSYEQGAGLINTYRAVQAALSYKDANGNPSPRGNALLASPDTLAATAAPNTKESFTVQITNDGASAETVAPRLVTLGQPTSSTSFTVQLSPQTDPTFIDSFGVTSAYVEQDFTVPAGAQRLDAAIAWDVSVQQFSRARLTLFDPRGRFAAYSLPQSPGAPFTSSGYGHVDVRFPAAGTWRAIIWTRLNSSVYSGPVQLSVSTSNFISAGGVAPASRRLLPGQTGTFLVTTNTPAQPGDASANLMVNAVDAGGNAHNGGDIPVVLRSLVSLGPNGGSFSGTLTGGNGRFPSPGQTLTYQFDVPAGLHDLDLNTAIPSSSYNLEGVLVDPNGLPIDVQSTITALDPNTGMPVSYTNTMQFFRRDPQAGRWMFVFFINDNSGPQTSIPFTGNIVFNGVNVMSSGVPNDPGITLTVGTSTTMQITVTNTGNTTKDFFVDPRLAQYGILSLGGAAVGLPLAVGAQLPPFLVPPESTSLTIAAESQQPTVPIQLEIQPLVGAPPYGGTGSPDLLGPSIVDPFTGNYASFVTSTAPEVVPGPWGAFPVEVGPYPISGAQPTTATVGGAAVTQQFDTAVSSDTGDLWGLLTGQTGGGYSPLTLAPGQSGTINVTISPTVAPGTVVNGFLYVDSVAVDPNGFLITGNGDELIRIPYSYTVGSAS